MTCPEENRFKGPPLPGVRSFGIRGNHPEKRSHLLPRYPPRAHMSHVHREQIRAVDSRGTYERISSG